MTATSLPSSLGTALTEGAIREVNFFNGRLVSSRDLVRTQQARQEGDARLGQALGAGVVQGLEVSVADAAALQLTITPGLCINAAGQTLCLGAETTLGLVASADTAAGTSSGAFDRCGVLSGGGYVLGNGLYLLVLAPLQQSEGKAAVLALEPGPLLCNADSLVRAVQFRLLRVDGHVLAKLGLDANPIGAPALSQWRSAVAYACFAYPALADAHASLATAPSGGALLDALRQQGVLTDCDLPLALVYMTADDGIVFVDAWAVRRRVAGSAAAPTWSAWYGPTLDALGEAQLAQFQQQLAEIPTAALAGLRAADWFSWLPAAGFLDSSGARSVDGLTFLAPRQPARTVALSPGDARAVLAQALRRDAVRLDARLPPRYRLYRIAGGPQCFVREAPNAPHAEEVWLDGDRARLPGVQDVQSAIDALRARQCAHLSVWPGTDVQGLVESQRGARNLHLCFEPGDYALARPLRLDDWDHVVLQGHGAATQLRCEDGAAALIISGCLSCRVEDLDCSGGAFAPVGEEWTREVMGALTLIDVPQVHILRVSTSCQDNKRLGAACMVVRQTEKTAARWPEPGLVRVIDCALQMGAAQIGLLCVESALTDLAHNRLRTADPARPAARGMVVAGSRTQHVNIAHNRVDGAALGIAAGLWREDTDRAEPLRAQRVSICHNDVALAVEREQRNGRPFGIFVGSTDSLVLEHNRVQCSDQRAAREAEAVAMLLEGEYGVHLSVRSNYLSGLLTGIAFSPEEPQERAVEMARTNHGPPCLWLFDGNLAQDAKIVLQVIERARERVIDRDNVTV